MVSDLWDQVKRHKPPIDSLVVRYQDIVLYLSGVVRTSAKARSLAALLNDFAAQQADNEGAGKMSDQDARESCVVDDRTPPHIVHAAFEDYVTLDDASAVPEGSYFTLGARARVMFDAPSLYYPLMVRHLMPQDAAALRDALSAWLVKHGHEEGAAPAPNNPPRPNLDEEDGA